ncbi:MAG: ABC transporter ATP-binding protein, partial [Candidatus Caldarchaeum sp.]|nr:ABC transporter ATP-binding protein [Candidatus Caldarchaeum sp.]MDW8436164.1 ABC transporter ATP-binding protein [Candidatus Caldarchaeum sp.]
MNETLIRLENIVKYFPIYRGILRRKVGDIKAVDGVSLDIKAGEVFCVVGESGSGKTTLGRISCGLIKPDSGTVYLRNTPLSELNGRGAANVRRKLQIIFQDPESSLNPRMTVEATLREALTVAGKTGSRVEALELLHMVGLRAEHLVRYPHELSGGQKQRVCIARALAVDPVFIVADEPVSALDVSIRTSILNLMLELQRRLNLTYLFISHDMAVTKYVADSVAVMYLGKICEMAPAHEFFRNPLHPYSKALLSSVPQFYSLWSGENISLVGDPPSAINPPPACRFHTRCPYAFDKCKVEEPKLI